LKLLSIILCSSVSLVLGCTDYGSANSDKWSSLDQNIMEAVFKYQIELFSPFQDTQVICLSLGPPLDNYDLNNNSNPSDSFISRFEGIQPPVEKLTSCFLNREDECFLVVDNDSGVYGIILNIIRIEHISETKAEVVGGYLETCISASGNLFIVVLEDDNWIVVDDVVLWVS